jgi:hypothetical protein
LRSVGNRLARYASIFMVFTSPVITHTPSQSDRGAWEK